MIELPKTDLPKQTDSPSSHLRGYGCKIHADTAMVQLYLNKVLSPQEVSLITDKAIKAGFVLDNAIPTTQNGWYRCYVKDPVSLIALTGEYLGKKVSGKEICRGAPLSKFIPIKYDFMVIEWATDLGSHFGLGDWVNGKIETTYNPWVGLKTNGIRTVRYWRIFNTE